MNYQQLLDDVKAFFRAKDTRGVWTKNQVASELERIEIKALRCDRGGWCDRRQDLQDDWRHDWQDDPRNDPPGDPRQLTLPGMGDEGDE